MIASYNMVKLYFKFNLLIFLCSVQFAFSLIEAHMVDDKIFKFETLPVFKKNGNRLTRLLEIIPY